MAVAGCHSMLVFTAYFLDMENAASADARPVFCVLRGKRVSGGKLYPLAAGRISAYVSVSEYTGAVLCHISFDIWGTGSVGCGTV